MRSNTPAEISSTLYDEYVENHTKPLNNFLIKRVLEEIENNKVSSGILLDIGTGTARTIIDMVEMEEFNKFNFIGVDYFIDMVNIAKRNVTTLGLTDRIIVSHGDVHNLQYEDNSFDLIIGRSVIHHWANPKKAYAEIYRVLKKGGMAIIHEPCSDPEINALEIFNKARKDFGINDIDLDEKYNINQIQSQLEEVGLRNVCTIKKGEGIAGIGFELIMKKL